MKILIANDSFKGSLDAVSVANAIEKGIKEVIKNADVVKRPLADGGEGTVNALVTSTAGVIHTTEATNPLGQKVNACFGILGSGDTAVIEMATASGLLLISEKERNPMITTTYGTGELIKAALDKGCSNFIIGIGGSATNDGGIGMAQALGVSFLNDKGREVGFGGRSLKEIVKISMASLDKRVKEAKFTIASDVNNPLCGPKGAAYIYGPQKGASKDEVQELDQGLCHYGRIVEKELGIHIQDVPGAGAAGGLGGGMLAFLNAELKPGIEVIIEQIHLEKDIMDCDLVITGEGKIDNQTIYGKVPFGVANFAKKYSIPTIAIAGSVSDDGYVINNYGVDAVFSIANYPISIEEAMEKNRTSSLISKNVEQIMRLITRFNITKGL